jgi:hypothetical protein
VKGRWVGAVPLPLREGDLWTPEKQSEVLRAIRDAFNTDSGNSFLLNQAGEIAVFYVDAVEEKDEATHSVKLTFRPIQVRLSLTKVGDNLLPIPRSASPSRLAAVPAPLLAFNPTFGAAYDRSFGASVLGSLRADLLALPDTLSGKLPEHPRPDHLDFRFDGAKSFEDYYRANAGLSYSWRKFGTTLGEVLFTGDYSGMQEPLAEQTHTGNAGGGSGAVTLRVGGHARLTLNTGYRYAGDTLEESGLSEHTATQVQPNRVLFESLVPGPVGGFLRAAIWEDNGWTDGNYGSHQRLAARLGYAREIAISPNQTIGIELIGGGGGLWGDAPSSRRFFGGNSSAQFLYDGANNPGLVQFPSGPLIRSFGQGQAVGTGAGANQGGNAFWHVNANLTVPIRRFSFPLIPQEEEVRNALRQGINVTGRNFLISALKNQGMSREEAVAEADKTFGEIRPATDFIIDEANLFAIKPLAMFDAAGLNGAGGNATWLAAGGGLQLTVVTARFEIGYMHTLTGPIHGNRGNVFFRLVFQNLF